MGEKTYLHSQVYVTCSMEILNKCIYAGTEICFFFVNSEVKCDFCICAIITFAFAFMNVNMLGWGLLVRQHQCTFPASVDSRGGISERRGGLCDLMGVFYMIIGFIEVAAEMYFHSQKNN